jgi:excinuclease ABC subunit B
VVLYADKVTGAMRQAIEETERRRERQIAYNEARGITPETIRKNVGPIFDFLRAAEDTAPALEAAEIRPEYGADESGEELETLIARMEAEMRVAAKELRFERAAELRDQVRGLKEVALLA